MGKTQWNTFLQLSRCLRRCQCHHFLCDLYPVWYLVPPAHRKTLIEFLHSPVGGKSRTIQPENSHVIQFYFLTSPPNSEGIFLSHMNLSGHAWLPFLPTLQRQSTLFLCPQIKYPCILRKIYHSLFLIFLQYRLYVSEQPLDFHADMSLLRKCHVKLPSDKGVIMVVA